MKKNIFKTVISTVLALALIIGLNTNVQALEIINNDNPFLEGNKEISTKDVVLDYNSMKKLPTSLGINSINLDIDALHDTNPLSKTDINMLSDKGYNSKQINSMDRGDYLEIKKTWKLTPEQIKAAKTVYPELENVNLFEWTDGQLMSYSKIKDFERYSPSSEQTKKLQERGITVSDAMHMLKDYYSYERILLLSDNEIKQYLLKYYKFKDDYAKSLKAIKNYKTNNHINSSTSSFRISHNEYIDGALYYYCDVLGYPADHFHVDSGTHLGFNEYLYGAAAQDIFEEIYNTTSSYSAANMWGTYSNSNGGAHEGIDYNGDPEGQNLKAIVDGTLGQRDSRWGQVAISSTETTHAYNYRIFYLHMLNISNSGSIYSGQTIGTEAGVGPEGTYQFDKHLHLQVYHNQSQTYPETSTNNQLESDSPYSILDPYV